jgi:hypothetical protein
VDRFALVVRLARVVFFAVDFLGPLEDARFDAVGRVALVDEDRPVRT